MSGPIVRLDRRVVIEQEIAAQDAAFGANVPVWSALGAFYAEVVDGLPSRSLAARQGLETASLQVRVRVRYDARLALAKRLRVRFGERLLQVVGGPAEMGRREFLELACEELATTGGA